MEKELLQKIERIEKEGGEFFKNINENFENYKILNIKNFEIFSLDVFKKMIEIASQPDDKNEYGKLSFNFHRFNVSFLIYKNAVVLFLNDRNGAIETRRKVYSYEEFLDNYLEIAIAILDFLTLKQS